MIEWNLLSDEEARRVWDQTLARFKDCSPFQTYAWGEYRRALGWKPCRWAYFNKQNEIVAMMQGSLRTYPLGVGLVWTEGGPVGDLLVCDERLHSAIKRTTGLKRIYCRFRCDRARRIEDVLRLTAQGWNRSWTPLTTSFSMSLDLGPDEEQLLAACDRNWRKDFVRARDLNLTIREWPDATAHDVMSVYRSMEELKGLDEQYSREEIEQMLKHLRQQLILYRCDDEHGNVVSLLGSLVVGKRACSLFSANSDRGRELRASFAMFWTMFRHCRRIGVTAYDLAGIDPVRHHGVYRFKRGMGATPIEYLGEWDWGSNAWWHWMGNWAIAQRGRLGWTSAVMKKSRLLFSAPWRPVAAAIRANLLS